MSKKSILITGSSGFIGSNLIKKIGANYNIVEFNTNHGDIATADLSFKGIDHVIHLAGQTFVPRSWEDPYTFYKTNILGTVNILDFCRRNNAPLTYISAYVYGIPEYLPIDEKHPMQAANPYMHSKVEAERICEFYAKNYKVKMTILRPFNIYGAGQSESFIIPKIIKQIISKDDFVDVLSLKPKRDYLYIDDLSSAIERTIDSENTFEIVNIGSGISYSVQEIISIAMDIAKVNKRIISEGEERRNEIPDVVADITKAQKLLGWSPKIDINSGLKKTIEIFSHGM